jgi:hypothetical protein
MTLAPITAAIRIGLFTSVAVWCSANIAHAGLSGPPPSYFQLTADGKHMLVMLSTVPVVDDFGNSCTLPDGQKVRLRDEFPSGGLYKLGSTKPVWKADWYEERGQVALSADGGYAVRINRFGDGTYVSGGALSWGLKFYEQGVEIKTHDVTDLIDYPSLMEFTSADWHFLWFDDCQAC